MKRAWICTLDYLTFVVGDIFRISIVEDLPINVPQNHYTIVDFDSSSIEEDCEKAVLIDGVWTIVEDTEKKQQKIEDKAVNLELLKMKYGNEILAYIGYKMNSFEVYDYQSMLSDNTITMIRTLLSQGALESSYFILNGYAPNGAITEDLKNDILLKIDYYMGLL